MKNISNNDLSDKELVEMNRKTANLDVLAIVFQRYMESSVSACFKYLKDSESARDAVMQIFEELVQKLNKHEVDNFKSWLYTLAKNYCLMQLRAPKNLKTTEFKGDFMQSEEEVHLNGIMQKEENFR